MSLVKKNLSFRGCVSSRGNLSFRWQIATAGVPTGFAMTLT